MYNIDDQCRPWRKALATDSTASGFASKIPTITEPTGNGVIQLAESGSPNGIVAGTIKLVPYATGSDNDAFDMRVIGWNRIGSGEAFNTVKTLWFPVILGQFSCTISAALGVAAAAIINTERFCDTITVAATGQLKSTDTDSVGAASTGTTFVISPTNDLIGMIVMPLWATEKIEITFDQTTNTPSMNCLYSLL